MPDLFGAQVIPRAGAVVDQDKIIPGALVFMEG
jgi:hypothetical protein